MRESDVGSKGVRNVDSEWDYCIWVANSLNNRRIDPDYDERSGRSLMHAFSLLVLCMYRALSSEL